MIGRFYPVFVLRDGSKEYMLFAANKLLEKQLVVNPRFKGEVDYDIEHFPWELQFSESPATYSLYLHALNPVFYLLRAYQFTGKNEYYSLAERIISSWLNYSKDKPKVKTNMMWYEHAVASRIEVFIYYMIMSREINGESELDLKAVINEHMLWNVDDSNYVKEHNHGIMQDLSILRGGYFFEDASYIDLAIGRLKEQIKHAFPNNIVHNENSIGYHLLTFSWVVKIEKIMKENDDLHSKDLLNLIRKSSEFLAWVISPTGNYPPYGDAFRDDPLKHRAEFIRIVDHISADELKMLRYSYSKGNEGLKPPSNYKLFREDGFSFIRSSWEKSDFENSLFILFKAGFSSLTHKHQDDLSFMLYNKGKEVFIDPGMYNYMIGNIYSDYLKSAYAHNTILVDNQSFPKGNNLRDKVGMISSIIKEEYIVTRAFNNLYRDVYIDRRLVYLNENEFYVIDDFVSNSNHRYTQNFHLSNDIEIIKHNLDYTLLKIKGTDWNLEIKQLEEIDSVTHKQGNTGVIDCMSIMATDLNDFVDSNSIQYHINGKTTRFVTGIYFIKQECTENMLNNKAVIKGTSLISSTGVAVDIQSRSRALPSEVKVEIYNNKLHVSNLYNKINNKKTKFDLINVKSLSENDRKFIFHRIKDKILKQKGQNNKVNMRKEHEKEFALKCGESYVLICSSIDDSGQQSIWKAGYVDSNKNCSFIYRPVELDESIPYVTKLTMTPDEDEEKRYRFYIDTIGFSNIKINWYVYRNGIGYYFKKTEEIQEFDYTFNETGMYSVILRVYDRFQGEVFFGNFPEIEIT